MLKGLTFSTFLLGLLAVTSALTADQISTAIDNLQKLRPTVLDQNVFDDPNTYQSKAKQSAVDNLVNVAGYQIFQVRQYYVAACIYHATNGVGNVRTETIIPGEPIPGWTVTAGWLTEPNYCLWFGILCYDSLSDEGNQGQQEAELKIVEINLSDNNLYGQFPNEISLLSNSLIAIDLFANFFHWCGDYRWMVAMENVEALFFGTTSWDANGIPVNLRFMTKLQELDMSRTFWRGELTENAFNNLKQLRYLDMGDNFFNLNNIETLPDYISGLPLLSNLYIENIRPFNPNPFAPSRLSLSFISRMRNLIEVWMDYTNVLGPIPDDIGDATSLLSFSCVYCKLLGSIPDSIVNTRINRMWLYGNRNLAGGFPPNFGTLDWTFLYLEGTGIDEDIPKAVCDQVGVDEARDLLELGADCDICPTGCCTCCGDVCNNLQSPTPAPTGEEEPSFCFPGDSVVEVQHQGLVKLSELALGDSIRVANNKFEPVYSFGHKNPKESAEFLAVYFHGNRKLEISENHMVMMEGGTVVPASMMKRGDKLLTASGDLVVVKTIRTVRRKGAYAPFTESGSIVVNNVVASNYVAFQGADTVHVAGVKTPLHYHWMAHMFNSVHRIAYKMGFATSETYTDNGTSHWVAGPREMGLWLLDQNVAVMAAGLIVYVFIFGLASILEVLMKSPMATVGVLAALVVTRRFLQPRHPTCKT